MQNNKTPTAEVMRAKTVRPTQAHHALDHQKKQGFCRDCKHFCDTAKTRRERTLKLGKTFCYCTSKPTAAHYTCELFAEVTA